MSMCTTKPPWGRTVEKCWLAVTVQQIIPLCFKHSAQVAEIFRGIWPSLACQRLMAYNSVSAHHIWSCDCVCVCVTAAKIPKCIGQSVCVSVYECWLWMFQSLPPRLTWCTVSPALARYEHAPTATSCCSPRPTRLRYCNASPRLSV